MSNRFENYGVQSDHASDSSALPVREHRRKAFKAGKVLYQNHTLTADCVIRDISSTGVKLQFQSDVIIPDHFTLTIPMEGKMVECQVRWRNQHQIGAVFTSDMELDPRNARKQSLDIEYVVGKKPSILRKAV